MLQVCVDSFTESVLAAFNKVASATSVCVHVNTSGNYIAPVDIDDFSSYNVQVDV